MVQVLDKGGIMSDITMCVPTKHLKKCKKCYRRSAKPSEYQSYADLYENCKDEKYEYFIPTEKND